MNSRIDELKKKLLDDTATFAEACEFIYLRFNPTAEQEAEIPETKTEDAIIETPKSIEPDTSSPQAVSGPTHETAPEIRDEIAGNAQVQARE